MATKKENYTRETASRTTKSFNRVANAKAAPITINTMVQAKNAITPIPTVVPQTAKTKKKEGN